MNCGDTSLLVRPRLPVEVCEAVIEAIHEFSSTRFHTNCTTCRACALVCRALLPRSQMTLFRTVELTNASALYKFSAHLDAVPHIAGYVRQLMLASRSLHSADSVVAVFPTILKGRLPNLVFLDCWRIFEDEIWHPEAKRQPLTKELPCLPLHPRFPTLMAPFGGITEIELVGVTFPSFGDLARALHSFCNLRHASLHTVGWMALGSLPSCMATESQPRFLPYLTELSVSDYPSYSLSRTPV